MHKVWTYPIGSSLSDEVLNQITEDGRHFVKAWTAHEKPLEAGFDIFRKKIIVVKVNENVNNASGCSIDKLVQFIKTLETRYEVSLLNRMLVAFEKQGELQVTTASEIKELLNTGAIDENTTVYDTAVADEGGFQNWKKTLKNSWLSKYLPESQNSKNPST